MYIDIVFLVLLAYSFIRGYMKGLVMAALSLIGYITAVFVTFYFTQRITLYFHLQQAWAPVVSYLVVFFAIVIAFVLLAKLIEKFLSAIQLNFINKLLGGLVGVLISIFVYSALIWVLHMVKAIPTNQLQESKTASVLLYIAPTLYKLVGFVFPVLKESLAQFQNYLNGVTHLH